MTSLRIYSTIISNRKRNVLTLLSVCFLRSSKGALNTGRPLLSVLFLICLTTWSNVFLEKLIFALVVHNLPASYGSKSLLRVQKIRALVPILSQLSPAHAVISHFRKNHFSIMFPSTPRSPKRCIPSCFLIKPLCMYFPSSLSLLNYPAVLDCAA